MCMQLRQAEGHHYIPQKRYGIDLKLQHYFPGWETGNIGAVSLKIALCFSGYYIFHIELKISEKDQMLEL